MEVPSNKELIDEYDRRRLPLLRELAHKANNIIYDKLKEGPISNSNEETISNPLIDDIEYRDADYLFFALWDRVKFGIIDLKIPPQAGYGVIYDKEFKQYTPNTERVQTKMNEFKFTHDWLPYLMLKNPDKLWFWYSQIYGNNMIKIMNILEKLKDGHEQETQFTRWINEIRESSGNRKFNSRHIYRGIIDMMADGRIDVIDSIYILLQNLDEKSVESFVNYITL